MITIIADDIMVQPITESSPVQYYAYDSAGHIIGYIRAKFGFCDAWCPDASGNDEVYCEDAKVWFDFESEAERDIHLQRAKERIATWCNSHPGVYGNQD